MDEHWRSCFATVCVGAGIWYMAAVHPSGLGDKYQMMHLRFAVSVVRTLVDETKARRRSCCVVCPQSSVVPEDRDELSVFIAGTPRMLYVLFPLSGLACARTSGIFTVSGAMCPRTLTSGPVQSQMNDHYPRNGIWYAGQSTNAGQATAP